MTLSWNSHNARANLIIYYCDYPHRLELEIKGGFLSCSAKQRMVFMS